MLNVPQEIETAIAAGALVVINHSGGKDSQAMTIALRQVVPADQLVVIHAALDGVEWKGTEQHARDTTAGLPFYTVRSGKTFVDMVRHRGMFPSSQHRQCTSDLKRDPINKKIRALVAERDCKIIVNCMGLRAEESTSRARQAPVKLNKRMSKAGRHMIDWLPIHDWSVEQVFSAIDGAGERPHWAYDAGMSRLSCCFCIMASKADLTRAAELNPALYAEFVALEREIDFTMQDRGTLEQITGIDIVDLAIAA